MVIWTLQPEAAYNQAMETGVYTCDPEQCPMPELFDAYRWLSKQMEKRIGPAPEGVEFPIWAWHTRGWWRSKPDLRTERWNCGPGNEDYVLLTLDVPDDQVLLSDFDSWHMVLNCQPITRSEEEFDEMWEELDGMSTSEKAAYLSKNWERVFNITPTENDWISRGSWIQATFWELRKEYIKEVKRFRTAARKAHKSN